MANQATNAARKMDDEIIKEAIRDCVFLHQMTSRDIIDAVTKSHGVSRNSVRRLFEKMNQTNDF